MPINILYEAFIVRETLALQRKKQQSFPTQHIARKFANFIADLFMYIKSAHTSAFGKTVENKG